MAIFRIHDRTLLDFIVCIHNTIIQLLNYVHDVFVNTDS